MRIHKRDSAHIKASSSRDGHTVVRAIYRVSVLAGVVRRFLMRKIATSASTV